MEYRPSRKSATRSRSENTTYYNKPFRWLQVVGSRLLSAFQLLSQCHLSFVSFVHALHVYPIFVFYVPHTHTQPRILDFSRASFFWGILEIGEKYRGKNARWRIDFLNPEIAYVRSFFSLFLERIRDKMKMLERKRGDF